MNCLPDVVMGLRGKHRLHSLYTHSLALDLITSSTLPFWKLNERQVL